MNNNGTRSSFISSRGRGGRTSKSGVTIADAYNDERSDHGNPHACRGTTTPIGRTTSERGGPNGGATRGGATRGGRGGRGRDGRGHERGGRGRGGHNRNTRSSHHEYVVPNVDGVVIDYQTVSSRMQFPALWRDHKTRDAIMYILSKSMRDIQRDDIYKAVANNINKEAADEYIYRALNTLYNSKQRKEEPEKIAEIRINMRLNDLKKMLTPDMKRCKSYLDLGGGDGTISEGIARWLNIKKENAISADVVSWLSGTQAQKKLKDITLETIPTAGRLPYKDNQFDAITCFVSLHHIQKIEERLDELYRIMAPGGWLLIREHDCRNNATRTIIDIYHNIYELVYNKSPDISNILDTFYADYRTKEQWHFLIQNAGFDLNTDVSYSDIRKDDLQRIYYFIYTKK